jgi:hypothetical protein
MSRRPASILTAAVLALLAITPSAHASFGFEHVDVTITDADGSPAMQAGSHPFAVKTTINFNVDPETGEPQDSPKDVITDLSPGLVGDPQAVPRCSNADFLTLQTVGEIEGIPSCPNPTAIGHIGILYPHSKVPGDIAPVYNLNPPPGVVARIGFRVIRTFVTADLGVRPGGDNNIYASLSNLQNFEPTTGGELTVWGNPADPAHDAQRGTCLFPPAGDKCPASIAVKPFLTLPGSCSGPLVTLFETDSWQTPGVFAKGKAETHDDSEPPNPLGMFGCDKLGFSPRIESKPTSESAETGSGLDFNLDIDDEGLRSATGLAQSDIKKAVITLPTGVTINPSVGEGLAVCTTAQLNRETAFSDPGAGCPNASQVGTLHVTTPLIDEALDGSIFLAPQDDAATTTPGAENPFDSLIALYFVIRNPTLGAIVKLPVKVEPDPQTGQLLVTLDNSPQFPISHFNAHLRTGARAALVTPASCGTYTTKAVFSPWAAPTQPLTTTASFQITRGVNGGPCPPGGVPPFHPDFLAGSLNNNAGSFSPFNMRLIRQDGEQDMTKFSAVLPPGELGSLAGVSKCPDSAIPTAKAKTGRQELASPSCPANSLIGHTLAGAGVGEALTYVKGQVYLGGPYHGDPLSVIAVTPAVAGPFDAGTVVVRLALNLNPKTAEVEVDGANSDPIPHILKGIVLKVRDLRVYVDRPDFTLNPTSCEESKARSVLFGSYLNVLDPADDRPVDLSTRYQAANCLNLGFKPKLNLKLKGGTRRGGHPGLTATYTPKKGDANVKGLVVRLPRSAFLDQAHIKTICTRVQFAAKACPKASQYGYIRAFTPLLEEPLQGPVYLRSSNHKLPDLVFDLHGLVDVEVATRIDSAQGGIRATVENAPDAPLSKVVLQMQGGSKGLIINSRNLCGHVSKANVEFTGHNGKEVSSNPVMRPECGGKRKRQR